MDGAKKTGKFIYQDLVNKHAEFNSISVALDLVKDEMNPVCAPYKILAEQKEKVRKEIIALENMEYTY